MVETVTYSGFSHHCILRKARLSSSRYLGMPYLRVVIYRGMVRPIRPRLCAVYIMFMDNKVIVYLATRLTDRQTDSMACLDALA